jgi:hypothetical protein
VAYVVTFTDLFPPVRHDDIQWERVHVEHATTVDGAYADLGSYAFPLDADPANPTAKSITITNAPAAAGWFRLTWTDAADGEQATDAFYWSGERAGYLPSRLDVARLLRARTRDSNGMEVGIFNAATRPTGAEVDGIIQQSASLVCAKIGVDLPQATHEQAANVIALHAAMMIEMAYWPESTSSTDSSYQRLLELYDRSLQDLQAAVVGAGGTGGGHTLASMKVGPVVLEDEA